MIQKASPHLRRVLAMFLVLCLLMGNVPVNAFAEDLGATTETVAETVTGGTSADTETEAEKQKTQESDTSAPVETPPQDNGVEAEQSNSSQQSSAENAGNAEQPSNDTAGSSEPSTDAPTMRRAESSAHTRTKMTKNRTSPFLKSAPL